MDIGQSAAESGQIGHASGMRKMMIGAAIGAATASIVAPLGFAHAGSSGCDTRAHYRYVLSQIHDQAAAAYRRDNVYAQDGTPMDDRSTLRLISRAAKNALAC